MRLEYAGLRTLIAPLQAMSPDRASAVSGWLWRQFAPHTRRHARVREHIAAAFPELAASERDRIALASWENLGRVFGEAVHVDRIAMDPERVELPDDIDHYRRLARKGCVFVSLHLGNWELAAAPALGKDIAIAGTYQAIQNPLVERYVRSLREPIYRGGLFPKGHAAARQTIALAKSGGAVGFLADLRERRGIKLSFFDRPAYANPFPAAIARRADVPIVAGCLVRTKGVHFRLHVREVEQARSNDRDRDIVETTQAIHDLFEHWIRRFPEQWMWSHRKWALRPEDTPKNEQR
ncbi:lysophospholipid acyltransferase family protein [Amorphus sp. 3PC139-8]|uniref:lysophospholipid acyltransferase family protein n=1 Tax=Amorphus sp. 3PC139-8 TaxID=2735676 RepID=UPI00345D212D